MRAGACGWALNKELCQDKITARQQDLDAEQDEAHLILEHFERQLVKNTQRPESDRILISTACAADWLNAALGEKWSKVAAGRMLNQKINEGRLPRLVKTANAERVDRTCRKERGFWWTPDRWDSETGNTVRPGGMETFNVDEFQAW